MSYIRAGHTMKYVEGESDDYVFESETFDSNYSYIEDYGKLTNKGIVEIIARQLEKLENPILHEYLIKHLAEKLNVELKKENYGDWDE